VLLILESNVANFERKALKDVIMPNGMKLSRGTNIAVDTSAMWDQSIYSNPETYDGFRFLKLRQEGGKRSSTAALASSSPEHFAFGLGKSICPGRFFAANEVKVALACILMNYDVRLKGGEKPTIVEMGFEMLADSGVGIEVRRRRDAKYI
jgi:cytochrome P450